MSQLLTARLCLFLVFNSNDVPLYFLFYVTFSTLNQFSKYSHMKHSLHIHNVQQNILHMYYVL